MRIIKFTINCFDGKERLFMKKLMMITLILALCLMCVGAAEEEEREIFTAGDYEYALLDDGTAEITKYSGLSETLVIPDTLDGHVVTAIGDGAFYWRSSLTSVTIPNSVTTIGVGAFQECYNLSSVTIPDSVTAMGANPFAICGKLTDIRLSPDHPYLAVIDGVLFSKPDQRLICYPYAISEKTYVIPTGIREIGNYAFFGCESLSNVTIPDSVAVIGTYAFFGCYSLSSVTIPDSVTEIRNYAFYRCWSLSSVTIPDSVTVIGDRAFSACYSLTSVTIPDSVTVIGDSAFYGCDSLTNMTIPDSVTSIGDNAFSCCENLTLTVGRYSHAKQYCIDNGLEYIYPDSLDWLND